VNDTSHTPARRRRPLRVAVSSLAAALLVAEAAFRVAAAVEDRNDLEKAMRAELPVPEEEASLAHVLRLNEDPRIVFEQRPNLTLNFQGLHLRTNSQGFRDRDYPAEKRPRVVRVVGIGDSIMWGWRVREADTFLAVVEGELNRRTDGRKWEVLNTAVNGYNTAIEVAAFEAKGLAFDPDLVVVAFCHNDLDLPNYIRLERDYWTPTRSFLVDAFRERFRRGELERPNVLSTLGMTLAPMSEDGVNFENDPSRVPERYRPLVGWPAFAGALARLHALADEHDFEVLFVVFRPQETPLKEKAVAEAESLGFHVVDVGAAERAWLEANNYPLPAYPRSPLVFGPDDLHPTALGNRLAADRILAYLEESGLADELGGE